MTRTLTGLDATFTVDGSGPRTASFADTQPGFTENINRIYFGMGNAQNDYRIDNVQLTVIPEPGSAALVMLGAGLLLRLRKLRP